MLSALREGFRSVGRNWGLVALVLASNLLLALVLAIPLAARIEADLAHRGASVGMMYGFDYDWWSRWSEDQQGYARSLSPAIFGTGFTFKNLDLLLGGQLPAGLFAGGVQALEGNGAPTASTDAVILGLGVLYLLLQTFLTGGLLGVFRAPRGGWTLRGLVHGAGFYFARLLRVSLVALATLGVVFGLNAPFARWVDGLAREAVSESTAIALVFGRHALLLFVLLLVHMAASFAKVTVVLEERRSALLAFVSSLGLCARNFAAALGQYLTVLLLGLLLLAAFGALDAGFPVSGWKSQLVLLVVFQAALFGRIALRLGLLASQLELARARGGR
jgi:hypothetical protein